jgi:hypothetical protein
VCEGDSGGTGETAELGTQELTGGGGYGWGRARWWAGEGWAAGGRRKEGGGGSGKGERVAGREDF